MVVADDVPQGLERGAGAGGVSGLQPGLERVQLGGEMGVGAVFVHPEQFGVLAAGEDGVERETLGPGFRLDLGAAGLIAGLLTRGDVGTLGFLVLEGFNGLVRFQGGRDFRDRRDSRVGWLVVLFGAVGEAGAGHAFAEAALFEEVFLLAPQQAVEQVGG